MPAQRRCASTPSGCAPMKSLPLPFVLPSPADHRRDARPGALRVVVPSTPPPTTQTVRRRSIWLALHFYDWPLRAALSGLTAAERATLEVQPLAVIDTD